MEHVDRGTQTTPNIQPWTDVSLRQGIAQTWAKNLPWLPRRVYQELAKIIPAERGSTEERKLQELRQRLLEKGETTKNAVQKLWVGELTNASSRLQQATARSLALPEMSS